MMYYMNSKYSNSKLLFFSLFLSCVQVYFVLFIPYLILSMPTWEVSLFTKTKSILYEPTMIAIPEFFIAFTKLLLLLWFY